MNFRKFGNTELSVSEIGFGAWAIGGNANVGGVEIGWGPSQDEVSIAALHAALDAGINFFDTANFYGLGHSESLLGKTFGNRADLLIASKVGQKIGIDGKIAIDYSKESLLAEAEASLRRLKRETIDFYQLHVARMVHLENGECIEAMQELKKAGKIRYWGISLITFDPFAEAKFLMDHSLGDGFQMVFNLINQKALPILQAAAEKGYGIIARMPLQFGLLTGNITSNTVFSAEDHRSYRVVPAITEAVLSVLEKEVWPLCQKYQTSPAGLALSFILSYPAISTVIPGIRTPEHVEKNTQHLVSLEARDQLHLQNLFQSHWQPVMQMMQAQG